MSRLGSAAAAHAAGIVHYFEGGLVALELYAEPKIVETIRSLRLPNLCLASTDMGRAKWVEAFANRLDAPVALVHKKRLSGSQTKVAAAVGDVADRDVVIYNIPYRTAVNLANDSLLELAEVSNIVGVKDSCGILSQSLDLLARKPAGFSVLTGEDALYFTMMANGADGGILASSHLMTGQFLEIPSLVERLRGVVDAIQDDREEGKRLAGLVAVAQGLR